MSQNQTVHVIVLLGQSPAVVTELAWWLVNNHYTVKVVEVWTSATSRDLLDLWKDMRREHPAMRCLPEHLDIRKFVPDQGIPLEDVRTQEDAALVTNLLVNRVRELRKERQGELVVGGMAGGRKTMSSALLTAFSMQAEPQDLLLHLWPHSRLEAWFRQERPIPFCIPTEAVATELRVPVEELVEAYSVPFVPLRTLLSRPSYASLLGQDPFDVAALHQFLAHPEETTAVLKVNRDGKSTFTVQSVLGQPEVIKLSDLQRDLLIEVLKADHLPVKDIAKTLSRADDSVYRGLRTLRNKLQPLPAYAHEFRLSFEDNIANMNGRNKVVVEEK